MVQDFLGVVDEPMWHPGWDKDDVSGTGLNDGLPDGVGAPPGVDDEEFFVDVAMERDAPPGAVSPKTSVRWANPKRAPSSR